MPKTKRIRRGDRVKTPAGTGEVVAAGDGIAYVQLDGTITWGALREFAISDLKPTDQ